MKTCGNHKDAVVVYADIRDRFLPKGVRLVSCPICKVMRGMEDASAKAIDESEEQIRGLNKRLGDAENDVALCQCSKCTLLHLRSGIDSLLFRASMGCCQKSEKT